MTNLEAKSLKNIRHLSIRKKTASRICSTQVLYEASFLINEIDIIIEYYLKNHLIHVLSSLNIKNFDRDLFNLIIKGVEKSNLLAQKLFKNYIVVNRTRYLKKHN